MDDLVQKYFFSRRVLISEFVTSSAHCTQTPINIHRTIRMTITTTTTDSKLHNNVLLYQAKNRTLSSLKDKDVLEERSMQLCRTVIKNKCFIIRETPKPHLKCHVFRDHSK